MAKQLIPAEHYKTRNIFQKDGDNYLRVSEFYSDTIQGEGMFAGTPSAFLRLTGCTLDCIYCDTTEVWRYGTNWTYSELIKVIEDSHLDEQLLNGWHLVITGGSPLLQQTRIVEFLNSFYNHFGFPPFVEIENECTLSPIPQLLPWVDCWNNSPKLSNSGVPFKKRYSALAIGDVARLPNSWFKFVINGEEDWEEIKDNYLDVRLFTKDQIILMPRAETREALIQIGPMVAELAIKHGVRYSSREHILLWGKKVGV